jgi:hypothetical protein
MLIGGVVGGVFAAAASHPADTVKTKMQVRQGARRAACWATHRQLPAVCLDAWCIGTWTCLLADTMPDMAHKLAYLYPLCVQLPAAAFTC